MTNTNNFENLKKKITLELLKEMKQSKGGHIGGSLSIVDVLTVLYGKQLKHDPKNPNWNDRDYLILSKGHAGPGLYAALAVAGFFDPSVLLTLNEGGTSLPSHPDRTKVPGVDMTTGSLGQGSSVAAGIAYDLKLNDKDQYVYVIVGDGELNEGQNWEAFQFIAHQNLSNCIVLIDDNKKQLDGYTEEIIKQFSIEEKMKAFGFTTQIVKNNYTEIDQAITIAKSNKATANCIILDGIKGQGVEYFAELYANHSVKFGDKETMVVDEIIEKLEKEVA